MLAFGGPALAETAEEAVAYAFMGLADGASFKRATTTMTWTEASASPAVFDGDVDIDGKAAKVRFTVTAVDPCHYEVALEGPMVPGGGKALYAKVDLIRRDRRDARHRRDPGRHRRRRILRDRAAPIRIA